MSESGTHPRTSASPAITLFYDGACPLCAREVAMLRRMDRNRSRLGFIDITAPEFDPAVYGLTAERVMAEMHGLTADNRVVRGMEVFRRAYRQVGWGWLVAPTGWPVLKPVFDGLYRVFAKNRLRLTGRCKRGACALPRVEDDAVIDRAA